MLAAAARRLRANEIEKRAKGIIARNGFEPVEDPVEELGKVAAEIIAFKDAVGLIVGRLEAMSYEHAQGEQLKAEVAVYERALDRSARTLESIIKLGLGERRAKIEEAKIVIVLAAINTAFAQIDLPAAEKKKAIEIFQRELSAIPS